MTVYLPIQQFVKEVFKKKQTPMLKHPLYPPDTTPCDFCIPRMISLRWSHFE